MPKIVDQERQRAAILRATWDAISKFGIAGVTIRRIASHARVSTGFISHYFRDKREVLAQALQLVDQQSQSRLDERTRGLRGLEALREAIEGVLPLDRERRLEWLLWLSFWSQAGAEAPLDRVSKNGRKQWRARIERLLEQAKEDGEIHPDLDIEFEADHLVVLVAGIGMHQGNRRVRSRARRFVADHLDRLTMTAPGPAVSPRLSKEEPRPHA